ncbi:MAG: glycosyltransferase family 2 protein [Candidatus Omnitrophica bacterium]|nr:glycosyltransferase family 2 protein [Candidatus Omnitrophota bacterium]
MRNISVIIPVFNEEESIGRLYQAAKPVLDSLKTAYELILVDDGSSDGTAAALERIHASDRTVKVITLRRNFGQTAAMSAGIDHAGGDIIITMDADLQNDPADIPRLLEKMSEGCDIVSGWRRDRKDKALSRKLPSQIANWMIGMITGVRIHDYGCTLKAYRASLLKELPLYSDMHRFIPALAALAGARVAEITVKHHPRRFGKSKYGISRTFKVLCDVMTVKLIIHFSSHPMAMFAFLATFFTFIGSIFGVQSLLIHLSRPSHVLTPLVHPTVSLLFFALGLYLFVLGILSEFILKVSDHRLFEMNSR